VVIHRRGVLAGVAALVLGVSSAGVAAGRSAAAPKPVRADAEQPAAGQVKEFSLTVGRVHWALSPGNTVEAYGYNGQVPGPELRVKEGDTVRVRVTNALAEATTIHWHGVEVPAGMDGVPGLSQDAIQPGGTFTYEFVAKPAGTRWYHAHVDELVQQGGGLAGPLIIEPREATSGAQREYVVVAQQWHDSSQQRPSGDHAGMGTMSGSMGGDSSEHDRFSINGKAYPNAAPLVVQQGERVRLRLINAGTTATQVFALAGHQLFVTHTDGNPLRVPVAVDAVPLGVGERADVEFLAASPGRWQLGSIASGQADRGLGVDVVYQGHETDPVQYPALSDVAVAGYSAMTGGPLPTTKADRSYELVLSGGMMGRPGVWTINGRTYPDTEPLTVRRGERVRIRIINRSMEDHPIHLHGHSFQIVAIGDRPVAGPFKDTVTLGHMDSYDIEFVADNPGRWLLHCHNLDHMMGGMMTELRYQ
jgi:FtsP/CotA-like multicopper oxidase with cupredoxin domain